MLIADFRRVLSRCHKYTKKMHQGQEGYSVGIRKTLWDSRTEKRKIYLTVSRQAGFASLGTGCGVGEEKTVFGIEVTLVQDAGLL